MHQKKFNWLRVFTLFCGLLFLLVSCGGGGGGSGNPSSGDGNNDGDGDGSDTAVFINWEKDAVSATGHITLPATSPIELSELQVDVYDYSAPADDKGNVALKFPKEQLVEAYIMLPERKEGSLPTIYHYTTVFPGETDVQFSAEETAISLLLGRVNHDILLAYTLTPSKIKQIVREKGAAFITEFVAAQDANPYLLDLLYIDDLYALPFEASADNCRSALIAAAAPTMLSTKAMQPQFWGGQQLYVQPKNPQYDFTVYEDTTGFLGIGSWVDLDDAGGVMTGELMIENDTMLFAHYTITDLLTGSEIKSLKFENSMHGRISAAFNPDLLGPQKGWNRLWWAGTAKTNVDFKSTKVVVYTPNIAFSDTATDLEKVIGGGLAFRTGATALMNVVSNFVPIDEDGWKHWFVEMYDRGWITASLDKFAAGDILGGTEELFWTFCDGVLMENFLNNYLGKHLKNKLEPKKIFVQLSNKFNKVTKVIPLTKIGLAVDIVKLVDDVVLTPGKITFSRAEFPFNLTDTAPSVVKKVSANDPLPVITITGMGLAPVLFDGTMYTPSVSLEAKNGKGKTITKVINEEDISMIGGGESLWFELPRDWAEVGSDVIGPMYLTVTHYFVDTHGTDELVYLKLPNAAHQSLFTLGLGTDVIITKLSKTKPVKEEEIMLFGQGFSPIASENRVYFTDHKGTTLEGNVENATATVLDVVVPAGLNFGPLSVQVKLTDKSESNRYALSLRPKPVQANPADNTHFDTSLSVSLSQEEGIDIFYSTIGNAVKIPYAGAIALLDTANIYPVARITVNGVDYDSTIGGFFYYKCGPGENLVKGVCEVPTNQVWKLIESTPYQDCGGYYTNRSQSPGNWSISYTESWGKDDTLTAEGTYSLVPSYLTADVEIPFTASITTTTTNENGTGKGFETLVWALTFTKYPLTPEGNLNLTEGSGATWHEVIARAVSSGNNSATLTKTLKLPLKGWINWAKYVVIHIKGGTGVAPGCALYYNHVYEWQE